MPTAATAIAMIMATVLAMKYISFDGTEACGDGEAVGAGFETLKYVCADEPP
jgi:hypothetical protein